MDGKCGVSPQDSLNFVLARLGVLRERALALFSSVDKLGDQEDGGHDDPNNSLMLAD